jgi:hypothetical protein
MIRMFAFLAAIFVSIVAVTSATAIASDDGPISFHITADRGNSGEVRATFSKRDRKHNEWSTGIPVNQLEGFSVASLRSGSDQPVRFAVVRDAGRLDCAGTGSRSIASGGCTFAASAAFNDFLGSRGVRRPNEDESFSMMALNVRRDLVEALHAARYPAPTPEDLVGLTALDVNAAYISGLSRVGYRPPNLEALLQFKALNITPEYIEGFVRHGYGNMNPDELVQLKALDISADYVASFQRVGYRNLTADQLVQLKALGVTADYAQAVQRGSAQLPSPDKLVELRAIGFQPR